MAQFNIKNYQNCPIWFKRYFILSIKCSNINLGENIIGKGIKVGCFSIKLTFLFFQILKHVDDL